MSISSYQIQNVLRIYNKQLRLEKVQNNTPKAGPRETQDEVYISLEGRRMQIFEQVASEVKDRLLGKEEEIVKE